MLLIKADIYVMVLMINSILKSHMIGRQFLEACDVIDWVNPAVLNKATELRGNSISVKEVSRRCFEFVRDEIKHSNDHKLDTITVRASDVLEQGTGVCYAKSHLLAALLRANSIPAALCYQRLSIEQGKFCLHGLNAVWLSEGVLNDLPEDGQWYRIDARGNRVASNGSPKVDAKFSPPNEVLAYPADQKGEIDSVKFYATPLPIVIEKMKNASCVSALDLDMPDLKSGL